MKNHVLALALLITPLALFAQDAEELFANRVQVGANAPFATEAQYWANPVNRSRLSEISTGVLNRVANDSEYKPSGAELNLVAIWWWRDGASQRLSDAALEVVKRSASYSSGYAVEHIRRWIRTNEDYAAFKNADYKVHGVSFLPNYPHFVANLATRFGDFATLDGMNRTQIFRWPYTGSDYKAWLRWKFQQIIDDQARYDFIQSELNLVSLSPGDPYQKNVLTILQQSADLTFQRLRRAQLLAKP